MRRRPTTAILVSLSVLLGAARPLFAVDGVIEISQAGVEAAGGFPYVITAPGSYRLTSNLVVSNSNTGVRVQAPGVAIDLNGFSLRGPQLGPQGGSAAGIEASQVLDTTVRNGSISGFSGPGIVGRELRVEDVRVTNNGQDGINAGRESAIRNVIATGNFGDGVEITGGLVTGCFLNGNGGYGVRTQEGINLVGFSNNVFPANALGPVGGTDGVNQGGNVCAQTICSCVLSPCP